MSDKVLVESIHNHGYDTFTSLQEKTEEITQIPSEAKSELRLFRKNKNCFDINNKLDHGVKCDFCQKEFSQIQNLNQHIALVHNEKAKIRVSKFKNLETNSIVLKKGKTQNESIQSVVKFSNKSIFDKKINQGQEIENRINKTPIPKGTVVSKNLVKMPTNSNVQEENKGLCYICGARYLEKGKLNMHMILVHYKEKKTHACSICSEKFTTKHLLKTHNSMFHVIKPAGKKTTKTAINHRNSTKKALNQAIDLPKTKSTASEITAHSGNATLRTSEEQPVDEKISVIDELPIRPQVQLIVSPTPKKTSNKSESSKSKRKSAISQKRISPKWEKINELKTSNSNEFILKTTADKEQFLSSNESTFIDRPDLDMEVTEMGAFPEESFADENSENKFESPASKNHIKKLKQKIMEKTTTKSEPSTTKVQNTTFEEQIKISEKTTIGLATTKSKPPTTEVQTTKFQTTVFEEHINTSEPQTNVHEGKKPCRFNKTHKCSLCGKIFGRKSELNIHLRNIHEGKNFHCEICELGFTFKSNLTRHVLKCCGKTTSEPPTIEITTTESEWSTTEVQTTKSGTTASEQQINTPEPPTIKMPIFNSEPAIMDIQFSKSKSPASEKYTKTKDSTTLEIKNTESEPPTTEKSQTTTSEKHINTSEPPTIEMPTINADPAITGVKFPKSKSPGSKEYNKTSEPTTIEITTTESEPPPTEVQTTKSQIAASGEHINASEPTTTEFEPSITNVQTTTFEENTFKEPSEKSCVFSRLLVTTIETTKYEKQITSESKSDEQETIEDGEPESMSESKSVTTAELKNDVHDISCNLCNQTFTQWADLRKHIAKVHDLIKCNPCSKTFTQWADLRKHITKVHEGKKPKVEKLKSKIRKQNTNKKEQKMKKDKSISVISTSTSTIEKPFATKSRTSSEEVILDQVSILSPEETIQEKLTSTKFHGILNKKDALNYNGKKLKRLSIVLERIDYSLNLNLNLIHKHRGKRNIAKCDICEFTFKAKNSGSAKLNLKQHIVKVHGSQRFNCPICNKSIKSTKSLETHIRFVHEGGDEFKCNVCDDICYKTQKALEYHNSTVHEGRKPFGCEICSESFEQGEKLKVSKFQKQIFLFSFEPKTEQNYFLIFGSKMGQVKKLLSIVLNTP